MRASITFKFVRMSVNWNVDEILQKLVKEIDQIVKYGIEKAPDVEKLLLQIVDQMFTPRQIMRQLAMISVLQVLLVCYSSLSTLWTKLISMITERGRKEQQLIDNVKSTKSYAEWQSAACALDKFHGFDVWRNQDPSTLYDFHVLEKRIHFTTEMLQRGDMFGLMFRLRGGLARDQFGMQHEGLFSRALAGTKYIVERYLETMAAGLNFICDSPIADEEVTLIIYKYNFVLVFTQLALFIC